jgi:hypothetical protein
LLSTLILVPLIGFGLYRRFKGSFGPQPLAPTRMIVRMVLLGVVCTLLVALAPEPTALAAAAGGLVVGVGLAFFGLAHTKFEDTPAGKFYTPNPWIGLVVTALFLGRLAARMIAVYGQTAAVAPAAHGYAPAQPGALTTGLLYLMAGYYVAYYAGVLRKSRTAAAVIAGSPPR